MVFDTKDNTIAKNSEEMYQYCFMCAIFLRLMFGVSSYSNEDFDSCKAVAEGAKNSFLQDVHMQSVYQNGFIRNGPIGKFEIRIQNADIAFSLWLRLNYYTQKMRGHR